MHVTHGRVLGQPTQQRTATFTGVVYQDLVLDAPDVLINSVVFTPGARTYWHRHPGGQLLIVTTGRGLVATRAGEARRAGKEKAVAKRALPKPGTWTVRAEGTASVRSTSYMSTRWSFPTCPTICHCHEVPGLGVQTWS